MNKNLNPERVLQDSKNLNLLYIDNLASKDLSDNEFSSKMQEQFSCHSKILNHI